MKYKYYYGTSKKTLINPHVTFTTYNLVCGDTTNCMMLSDGHFTNDFAEVLEFFNSDDVKAINLSFVDFEDGEKIFDGVKDNVEYIHFSNCDFDYKAIENFVNIKYVTISHNKEVFDLWNLKNNKNLQMLNIVINNCKVFNNIENLENSTVEYLSIKTCKPVPDKYKSIKIGSLKVLEKMPILKQVEIYVVSKNDKLEELVAMAKLKTIETLKLQKGHFTFEQFAWLKSKLEHIKDLNCLYEFKYNKFYDTQAGVIIGKNKPNSYLDYSKKGLDRYIEKYKVLVQNYKNEKLPPNNFN